MKAINYVIFVISMRIK